ncbi:NAD(P)-binding Rossmann-fold containing protein [Glarea lozoyensis ATCC 20868]|uniref:NAD(P)-binding Rossmann-fold containing protein n=1 Tax=Glarea lozoyensis (strain ATCC 20868 / MF5171) TaxID=1116229 RepID=S3DAX6_GLAL2|nr:NAD(P)-binding Rossmann-fold containing protein [Glarea lozoyensis ATCC 20868]EPE34865.1 NAD(P)-binding Rossmann-fold containing protein [Glarea lozoyensis ATCC 20868]
MASINSGVGKTVLVTGGSGYVAAEVLNSFLIRGYNVKTTVRNEASAEKIKKSHAKYLDQLSFAIVKDLQLPGGHDEAVKGVDGVIHTASPFVLQVEDNARDLLEPAVNGTLEVLKSVQKNNPAVKRVVITSSFAAIIDIFQGPRPGYTYTEKDWNPTTYDVAANPSTPGGVSYCASKSFAEKAAFDYVAEHNPNFTITALNPPMVYGPSSVLFPGFDKLNTSSADIYRLINGTSSSVPETSFFGFVDVRDLAEAHVRAYESEDAAGQRYITCSGGYTYQQICDVIRAEFPGKRDVVPEGNVGEKYPDVYVVDNGKIRRELGMEFRSLKTCVVDMVEQFIEYEKA